MDGDESGARAAGTRRGGAGGGGGVEGRRAGLDRQNSCDRGAGGDWGRGGVNGDVDSLAGSDGHG